MPWTATTLRDAIKSYTQNYETTFTTTYVDTSIIVAEDRISKAVILPVNRANDTLNFVNGTATVAVPTGFLAPFELRAVVAGVYTPVDYVDVSFIRSAYPNPTTTGTPRWYSMLDATTLILGPTPGSGMTGWFNFFKKPASITVTSPSWLGTNAEACLLYGCLSEAYTYMKGASDMQQLYEGKFQAALAELKKLGEGLDLGDAYRMGERRTSR